MRCQISTDDSNEDKVSFLPGLSDSTVKVNGQALVDSGPKRLDRFIMNCKSHGPIRPVCEVPVDK